MTGKAQQPETSYTQADLDAVLDNPPWTRQTSARSKPFDAVFPDLARRVRGPQKTLPKKQITLRLDSSVIDYFRSSGQGWQSRINDVLKKAAGL